jgi:hypothetical protein
MTTVGIDMSVLVTVRTPSRPGKRVLARSTPRGHPTIVARIVDVKATRMDTQTVKANSGSRLKMIPKACQTPWKM